MPDRDERKALAAKHLALMKGALASETAATIAAATVYEDGEGRELPLPEPAFDATDTLVTTAFAPAALREAHGKTAVVDPASFTRPGGGYEDGAFGPEQVLCSESNLYPILCGLKDAYHDRNRGCQRGQLFTDRALYLPGVAFSHAGALRTADVIAIPEPNRAHALANHRSERECDLVLAERIEALLRIAAANEVETLVCGAFGCGREGYDPSQVIELFRAWIEAHPGAVGRIVFAVPRAHYDAFDAAFGKPRIEEPSPAADEEDADEDEFDPSTIELPEGVTLR